ncbi:helix-turn-helix domain-containing protein [Providencia stuartii]
MRFDDNFPKRLASARNAAGLTQANLASRAETVVRQIAAYEAGDARPRLKTLQKMAAALGTTEEWLCEGIGEAPTSESFSRLRTVNQIPLFLYEHEIIEFVETGKTSIGQRLHSTDIDVSNKAFAYPVFGQSMISNGTILDNEGRNLSFPEGTIVTVDPEASFINDGIALICQNGLLRVRKISVSPNHKVNIVAFNSIEYPPEIGVTIGFDFIYPVIKSEIYLQPARQKLKEIAREDIQAWNKGAPIIEGNDLSERLDKIEAALSKIIKKLK